MLDFNAHKRLAIGYWERRRIIYNAVLVFPALAGYGLANTINWVGTPLRIHYSHVIPMFLIAALGANVCYSFCYALEFVFGSTDPTSRWMRFGRTAAFVSGVSLAALLALIGGRNIAVMEWHYGSRHAG